MIMVTLPAAIARPDRGQHGSENCHLFRASNRSDRLLPVMESELKSPTFAAPEIPSSNDPHRTPAVDAAIAIVVRAEPSTGRPQVLVSRRKDDDDALPGYWEFPGGKCEDGETLEQCLARELCEELDISAEPIRRLPPIEHAYPKVTVRLHPFICRHDGTEPKLLECQAVRWIDPASLRDYQFPPANESLIEGVIALLSAAHLADVDFTSGQE
jgi:8-oxo-dGTP diphosphatase